MSVALHRARHRRIAQKALRTCAYPNSSLGDSRDTKIGLVVLVILIVLFALEWL